MENFIKVRNNAIFEAAEKVFPNPKMKGSFSGLRIVIRAFQSGERFASETCALDMNKNSAEILKEIKMNRLKNVILGSIDDLSCIAKEYQHNIADVINQGFVAGASFVIEMAEKEASLKKLVI